MNRIGLPSRRAIAAPVAVLICILIFATARTARADSSATQAAKLLADRVAVQLNSKVEYRVEFRDLTGQMSAQDRAEARNAFVSELTSRGAHVAPYVGDPLIQVSLSSDTRSRLWVAEFPKDGNSAAEMESFPLFAEAGISTAPTDVFALRKQLLFQQRAPMLDFALTGQSADPNSPLLILTRDQIGAFLFRNGRWEPQGSYLPVQFRGFARDSIGRITLFGEKFQAQVANVTCFGTSADLSKTLCNSPVTAEWDFGVPGGLELKGMSVPGRNWFGVLDDDIDHLRKPIQFYSAAEFIVSGKSFSVIADTDRKIYVSSNGAYEPMASAPIWGSQLAGLRSACNSDTYLLTTFANDYGAADHVQAYQSTTEGLILTGAAVEFDGPVLTLWADAHAGVRAIVHNLKTGFYEAYLLNTACNR